ncbi:hypothetical protein GJAV_G00089390 [Gymnothorax javanicus]|nr:hypothetical protein GJAV_G00089390 [Gymnothorax javanicus]
MLQVVQRRDVVHYGKLEEFVSVATEAVPELLTDTQWDQLSLRLQAREGSLVGVGSEAGPSLLVLLWDFLSKLEQLLPTPDLGQTVSWLSAAPSVVEECLQSISNPQHLKCVLKHHRGLSCVDRAEVSPAIIECKLSSEPHPSCRRVADLPNFTSTISQPENFNNQPDYTSTQPDYSDGQMVCTPFSVSVCAEIKAESVTDCKHHEGAEPGAVVDRCKDLEESSEGTVGCSIKEEEEMLISMKQEDEEDNEEWSVEMVRVQYEGNEASDEEEEEEEEEETSQHNFPEPASSKNEPPRPLETPSAPTQSRTSAPGPQCGDNVGAPMLLPEHKRVLAGDRPYLCSQCGKSFADGSGLRAHQCTDPGVRSNKCSQCTKSFRERPYKCSDCGKSFTWIASLKVHQCRHSGERPHSCPQCGKSFSQLEYLTIHQRTHTGERPYKCSQCGKRFTQLGSLNVHLRTHTGERPYVCPHCSKSFIRLSGLKRHLRIHTGERPYQCSQCGKSFTQLGNLNIHLRTHTGERLYKCSQCDKSFVHMSALSKHRRSHTETCLQKIPLLE